MLDKQSFLTSPLGAGNFAWKKMEIPTPFPVGPVNVYLLWSEPLTLVDAGPDTPESREALTSALAEVGLVPRDIEQVLLTHSHSDHAGLAGWFQEMGAEVFVHPLEAEKLSGLDFWPARHAYLRQMGVTSELLTAAQSLAKRAAAYRGCLEDYRPLQEGEVLCFNGFRLSALFVPGHCGGHLAFYQEESGVLLAGDTLLKHISPNPLAEVHPSRPGERSASLGQFLATLDRLESMAFQLVLPGHGEALEAPGPRIAAIRCHHQKRLQRIREMVQAGGSCTPFALAGQLYGRLNGWDVLLAVSEVSAHLDLLADRGEVTETIDSGGHVRYAV